MDKMKCIVLLLWLVAFAAAEDDKVRRQTLTHHRHRLTARIAQVHSIDNDTNDPDLGDAATTGEKWGFGGVHTFGASCSPVAGD